MLLYRKNRKIGCQGVKTPYHKGFAPCWRVTKGDKRMTSCAPPKNDFRFGLNEYRQEVVL